MSPAPSPIPQSLEMPVQQILVTIINSDISHYQHQAVQLTYFEVIVRYLKYIPMGRECFEKVILSFLDGRGIRNSVATVRRRANYLFQRFAKILKLQLHPYVSQIIENIRPILALNSTVQQSFSFDDQISLYEALGSIIGSRPQGYPTFARELLAPLVACQQEALAALKTASPSTLSPSASPPSVSPALSPIQSFNAASQIYNSTFFKQHLNAITVFSKGFSLIGNSENDVLVATYFVEALNVAVQVLNCFNNDPSLWTHLSTLLHRIIESLGTFAATNIASVLNALLQSFTAICLAPTIPPSEKRTAFLSEVGDMLTLYGQVSSKFKESAGAIVDSTLVDFLTITATVIGPEMKKYAQNCGNSGLLSQASVPPLSKTIAAAVFEDGTTTTPAAAAGGADQQVRAAGEDLRELLGVHKAFMQCITTLTTNSGKYLIENSKFITSLSVFFDFVLCELFIPVGSSNIVQSHKYVVGFLSKCLEFWGSKGKMTQFISFANSTIAPIILKTLVVRSDLPVNDASVHFLVEECLKFFVLTASLVGPNEFAANVVGSVLPGMSCPQQIASTFAQAVVTCVSAPSNENGKRAVAVIKEMTKSSNY